MLPHLQEFLNYLISNNYADKTLFNYSRDLIAFASFLNLRSIDFNKINRHTVDEYKSVLRSPEHHKLFLDKGFRDNRAVVTQDSSENKSIPVRRLTTSNSVPGLASKSINRMLSSLRKYLRYLILNDYDCPLPPDRVEFVKREKKESQLADYQDLIRLIECPDEFEKDSLIQKRNRAFLELLFSTGMRISEACNLNLDQIGRWDELNGNFILNERIYILGKGRKQRFVYLTPRCQHYLSRYLQQRKADKLPALFLPAKGKRMHLEDPQLIRVSNNYFQMKIINYRKRLGINVKTSAHSLRHGFATFMAENGANIAGLQTLLGHESLATTTKYLHTSERLAEETHRDFHPLSNVEISKK